MPKNAETINSRSNVEHMMRFVSRPCAAAENSNCQAKSHCDAAPQALITCRVERPGFFHVKHSIVSYHFPIFTGKTGKL